LQQAGKTQDAVRSATTHIWNITRTQAHAIKRRRRLLLYAALPNGTMSWAHPRTAPVDRRA
jgi:hypothetical protein